MHRYLLHNGAIHETSRKLLSPGQVGLLSGWGVFSTILVTGGVLFAFERHWARMRRDAALLRISFPTDSAEVRGWLLELVEANRAWEATLRIAVVRNRGGMWEGPGIDRDADLIAYTADLQTWGAGVRLAVQPNARHSACGFAGTKMLSWAFNLAWLEQARERGFDEVVLLNEMGQISECTSANVFLAHGDRIWTPPLSSGCLPGVTRELLLEEVRVQGITVAEKPLRPQELESADEVFITSTTRGLLPVLAVDGFTVRQNGSARAPIEAAYAEYLRNYVGRVRSRLETRF